MARLVEWDGEPFAVLIESPDGDYLLPPIVLDEKGRPIEGQELLQAIVDIGVAVEYPVLTAKTPAALAEFDQRMARIAESLGVPIGLPDEGAKSD